MTLPSSDKGAPEALLHELRWLRGLALRLVRDEHTADDVVQDTWVAAAEKAPAGLEGSGLRAWLATVARNLVRRRGRDESLRRRHESACLAELVETEPPDEVERLRRQRRVADLVLELREPYRSAVVQRFQEGWSYGRIATRQGIQKDAARKRVSRGLALLRERLDREHGGDRRAWCTLLIGLVDRPQLLPFAPSLSTAGVSLGGITMGIKTMAAVAGVLVAAVGLVVWFEGRGGARQPAQAAQVPVTAEPLVAPDLPPEEAAAPLSERVVSPEAPAPLVGAVASADLERDLHGRVIDPAGLPVPGASVVVRKNDIRQVNKLDIELDKTGVLLAEATTDALGEFAIPLEPGHAHVLVVEHEEYAAAKLADRYAGEFVEIQLDLPAVFAGRVFRESDGEGIPAQLNAWFRSGDSVYVLDDRTRPDGTFRFEGLEARTITVEVHPEGAADPAWQSVDLIAGETVNLEIPCPAGDVVRGRVTDGQTGRPIAGAQVGQGWTFDRPVRTDANGEYRFEHFKLEGVWEVAARAAGYGRMVRAVESSSEGFVIDFALPPARRVAGCVVDAQGEPLEGVYVAAIASVHVGTQQTDWRSTRTLPDGTFEITDVRADIRHVLKLYRSGFADATYDFPPDELEHPFLDLGTLALKPPSRVMGVVVSEDGEPVVNASLELDGTNADRDLLGGSHNTEGLHYVGSREGRTDHLGRFAFADLPAGTFELRVRSRSGPWKKQAVVVPPETVLEDVRVTLTLGLELTGRVVDPDGNPVFCVVSAQAVPMTQDGMFQRLTGADGAFEFSGLVEGRYDLQAFLIDDTVEPLLDGQLEGVEAGTQDVEIVMAWGAMIAGEVLDAQGKPVLNAAVRALDPDGDMEALDFTDAEGRFELAVEAGLVADLLATPPPATDAGEFYEFSLVSEDLGARLPAVEAGRDDLVLTLPETP